MNTFKSILNLLVVFLLILSVALNVLTFCGFKLVKKTAGEPPLCEVEEETAASKPMKPNRDDKPRGEDGPKVEVTITEDEKKPCEECPELLIFEDDNIKVTYHCFKNTADGPVYKFKIENLSTKTLNVLFTEVYINGREVYISGLTCEHLLPDTARVEDFVLINKDWEHFTEAPEQVSFKIKLVNDPSRLDLYETDRITLTF